VAWCRSRAPKMGEGECLAKSFDGFAVSTRAVGRRDTEVVGLLPPYLYCIDRTGSQPGAGDLSDELACSPGSVRLDKSPLAMALLLVIW
jgi:hypothetical protein